MIKVYDPVAKTSYPSPSRCIARQDILRQHPLAVFHVISPEEIIATACNGIGKASVHVATILEVPGIMDMKKAEGPGGSAEPKKSHVPVSVMQETLLAALSETYAQDAIEPSIVVGHSRRKPNLFGAIYRFGGANVGSQIDLVKVEGVETLNELYRVLAKKWLMDFPDSFNVRKLKHLVG